MLTLKAYGQEVSELLAMMGYSHIPLLSAFYDTVAMFYRAGKTTEQCAKSIARIYVIMGYRKRGS